MVQKNTPYKIQCWDDKYNDLVEIPFSGNLDNRQVI
jgi:hypothetical protein